MKQILFTIIILIFIGCSKDNAPFETEPLDYMPGEVAFGLRDSVSLSQLADYVYALEKISIKSVVSFIYRSRLSQDSLSALRTALEAKTYIENGTLRLVFSLPDSVAEVEFWIKDFKNEDRADWRVTVNRFRLQHYPQRYQLGVLKVEIGTEEEWIKELQNTNLFRFVELNYISRISK